MKANILFILLFGLLITDLSSQSVSDWTGTVYKLPERYLKNGYHPEIENLDPYKIVKYNDVNVGNRMTDEPFKDIDLKRAFGMVLHATLTVDSFSYYKFTIGSDDGSRLWVDDLLVINNDKDHAFRYKEDSIVLQPGVHQLKLWYYQAYKFWYGLEFDVIKASIPGVRESKISISTDMLFESGIDTIHSDSKAKLLTWMDSLDAKQIVGILVIGHTDNVGSHSNNLKLSKSRADHVANIIRNQFTTLSLTSEGKGEADPIFTNKTEEGRAGNRRVEIVVRSYQ